MAREWQFDGIVGPTHNYAGLALGNLAAASNKGQVSNPRLAALQGLEKMKFVRDLGVPQAFLPPHYRPMVSELRRAGFLGDLGSMLDSVYKISPGLLASVYSSSFMWAANAATITSSVDNNDGRLHLTPANLVSHYHRSIEAEAHVHGLKHIFHNKKLFCIHNYLSPADSFGDEGAANHMSVQIKYGKNGHNIFVYGKSSERTFNSQKYPSRQHRLASEAVARLHGLDQNYCLFFQQSPEAIDHGVFHNDVIALNTTSRMIIHQKALISEDQKQLKALFSSHPTYRLREVTSEELSIDDSVSTYLFNSQYLELANGRFVLVAPSECSNHAGAKELIHTLRSEGMIDQEYYLDVRESMRNGGGPACLRLRIVMTPEQESAFHPGVVLTDDCLKNVQDWVMAHYRDRLTFDDLRDPEFVKELEDAYSAFEAVVGMPGFYDRFRG